MFALRTTLRRAQPMASRVIVPARPFSLSAIRLWNANEGVSYPEFKKYTQQPSDVSSLSSETLFGCIAY